MSYIPSVLSNDRPAETPVESLTDLSIKEPTPAALKGFQKFLEIFCQYMKMKLEWLCPNLALLHLSNEAASLLEGRRIPGYTCKLALSPQTAAKHPDAALFMPGSYHWDRILEIVREKASNCSKYVVEITALGKAVSLPETDGGLLVYEPHLLIHWCLNYVTGNVSQQRNLDLAINLISGDLFYGYFQSLLACQLEETPLPHIPKTRAKISYKKAYDFMLQELNYMLSNESSAWAKPAQAHLELELTALAKYYAGQSTEESSFNKSQWEYDKSRRELKQRLAPRVMASPFATALIYAPIITYEMDFDGEVLALRFDPVTGQSLG
ncbi:MAG: hypothetical protein GX316_05380 [Firmicutes bacterium]|nr:hypothetical protein [Bacillota bacterium]